MWFSDLCAEKAQTNAASNDPVLREITFPMLTGTAAFDDPNHQANIPVEIHEQLREIGMEAWKRLLPMGENYGFWTKVVQKSNEPYVEFLARL